MERYEMLNRALMPAEYVVSTAINALKKAGIYGPLQEVGYKKVKDLMRKNFENNFKLKIVGESNLPEGAVILAANHQSWLDAQVLGVGLNRKIHFLAKSDFIEWPLLHHFMDFTETLYIRRGGDDEGLGNAVRALKSGRTIAIFPEGTIPGEEDIPRWAVEPDTGLLRGHSGVLRMALRANVPVVPAGISGTGKVYPPEAFPRLQILPVQKKYPITINIGKPMYFSDNPDTVTREKLRELTHELMLAISKLVDFSQSYEPVVLPITSKTEPSSIPPTPIKNPSRKNKSKFGVLVLHGFTSHISCVSGIAPYLEKLKLPYRFPILRGHGTKWEDLKGVKASDWYEDAENSMLDLCKEAEKVIAIGLSMGGLVALDLGAKHPDKVAAVVAVAAALKFKDPLSILTPLMEKLFSSWKSPDAYHDRECAKANRNYPKFPTDAFHSLYDYASYIKNNLSFFKVPIRILHSRKDQVISPSAAITIYNKISTPKEKKELVWFEKSGHEMMLDLEKEAVFEAISEYVEKIIKRT
jgi:carboxylesterase